MLITLIQSLEWFVLVVFVLGVFTQANVLGALVLVLPAVVHASVKGIAVEAVTVVGVAFGAWVTPSPCVADLPPCVAACGPCGPWLPPPSW